jgi:hypothetical protein
VKTRNFLFILILPVIFILSFIGSISLQNTPDKDKDLSYQPFETGVFAVGEELNYEVSYSFIKLGSIKMKVLDKYTRNGRVIYKTKSFIDSYNIPLVSLHNVFESELDEEFYCHQFIGSELIDNDWRYTKYNFDYTHNNVYMERGYQSKHNIEWRDTADLKNKKYQDGLGLFFFARGSLFSQRNLHIPVLIGDKCNTTLIKYPCTHDEASIDAVNYPVDVLYFEGNADWVGIFGLTGKFRGWFSNDSARVPITARMNVILGSIYIELKSWNRPGWYPPKKN